MDFDYKKYSLEKLEEWVHDTMSGDASPHEIYSTIREVVRENYYYHKEHTSRAYGLLELLSGHRPVEDKELLETVLAERDYYEGVDESFEETLKREGYEWTPLPDADVSRNDSNRITFEDGWVYESPDGGKTITKRRPGCSEKVLVTEDKVVKWQLPVEVDGASGEYFVSFPDDLLETAALKEGDQVEWVDQGNGSYLLRKV